MYDVSEGREYAGGGLEGMLGQERFISISRSRSRSVSEGLASVVHEEVDEGAKGYIVSGELSMVCMCVAHCATSAAVPVTDTMNGLLCFRFSGVGVEPLTDGGDEDGDGGGSKSPARLMRMSMFMYVSNAIGL